MALNILLYDSSPIVQKIFSHVLYHYLPTINLTDHPKQLLEAIQKYQPDIIFIDHALSLLPNKKIDSHLTQQQSFRNKPVIVMGQRNLKEKELQLYCAKGFLKKPLESHKLREIIEHFVLKTRSHILKEHLDFPKMDTTINTPLGFQPTTVNLSAVQKPFESSSYKEISQKKQHKPTATKKKALNQNSSNSGIELIQINDDPKKATVKVS